MVCSDWPQANLGKQAGLAQWSPTLKTMVLVDQISSAEQMFDRHYQIQPAGSAWVDWCESGEVDPAIHPAGYPPTILTPTMMTWQTSLLDCMPLICGHFEKAIFLDYDLDHIGNSQQPPPLQKTSNNHRLWFGSVDWLSPPPYESCNQFNQ